MTVVVMLRWQYTRFVAQRAPGLLPTWNGRSNGAWLSYLKAIWPEWNEKQESINSLGVQFAPWAEALKRTNHVGSGHWKMNCERPGLLWPALAWHSATARRDVSMSESEIQVSSHHICICLFPPLATLEKSKCLDCWKYSEPPFHLQAICHLLPSNYCSPHPSLSTDINHLLAHCQALVIPGQSGRCRVDVGKRSEQKFS